MSFTDYVPRSLPVGRYRWRIPSVGVPGIVVQFNANVRSRGAGYEHDVASPEFDYWDGWNIQLPKSVQWAPITAPYVDQKLQVGRDTFTCVAVEGVSPDPCPYCQKMPRWQGLFQGTFGDIIHGSSPEKFNSWWLECCAWAKTPRATDPRKLSADRSKLLRSWLEGVPC